MQQTEMLLYRSNTRSFFKEKLEKATDSSPVSLAELTNQGAGRDASTRQARLWLCKAIMQEVLHKLLAASSKKDLAPKTCVLQHPAFKGLAPRVDPGVRVLGAFAASEKSQIPPRL